MPSPNEKMIVLRRFDGVNLLVDQAYLGPSYLVQANNWIPGNTFRLVKMPGNLPYPGGPILPTTFTVGRVIKMIRAYAGGNRFLYAVATPNPPGSTVDQLWVSMNDGAWTRVQKSSGGNADFTQTAAIYDMAILNQILYVGNGVDPIFAILIGGTATALKAIAAFTDGSAAPTTSADAGSQILTGTYSYCWSIYDHTGNFWVERGQSRTVQVSTTGSQAITFPTPTGFASNGGALSSQFRAHLFIAPINLPFEFGHDHTPDGIQTAGSFICRFITADGPPLPLSGPARTGRIFRSHRGRLWIAGDQTTAPVTGIGNTTAVWATYLVVPGLEQAVFNAGLFFPYNARTPRTFQDVTAIGTADTGGDDPQAPLIVCTLAETFLFYGDILDDPNAYWIRVSKIIGCINQDTMVETPVGTIFVGLQSVYMIPPGGGPPVDIGWPIRPSIAQIPPTSRIRCTAIYHKGFYKLAIVPQGDTKATVQWWLDLRQGLGRVPSWWGPHTRAPVSAWCVGQQDDAEPDRGFMAVDIFGVSSAGAQWNVSKWDVGLWGVGGPFTSIELIHQIDTFSENQGTQAIVSILQTGDLDDGAPFDRKIFTRVRATLFPGTSTSLGVGVSVDGGSVGPFDAMIVAAPTGAVWNASQWDVAQWSAAGQISEGESVAPEARPRGRTGSVQITHSEPKALAMRDFELRYLPVARPIRVLSTDPTS